MTSRTRIFAVANCKGGCGKTTTAVNLASEFAARGLRIMLVDLDPQGHSTLAVGARGLAQGKYAHDLLLGAALCDEDILRLPKAGLDLLPANPKFQATRTHRAQALGIALSAVEAAYDAMILDTPPAADLPLIAALGAAHRVLTPTQLTPLARDGVLRFAQVFFYVSTQLNRDLASLALLPIQTDIRTRVQQSVAAQLVVDFGVDRICPSIRSDTALAEAFAYGAPIGKFRPAARGAIDYAALAEHLLQRWF